MKDTNYKEALDEALLLMRNYYAGAIPRTVVEKFIERHRDGNTDSVMLTYNNIVALARILSDMLDSSSYVDPKVPAVPIIEMRAVTKNLGRELKVLDKKLKGEP